MNRLVRPFAFDVILVDLVVLAAVMPFRILFLADAAARAPADATNTFMWACCVETLLILGSVMTLLGVQSCNRIPPMWTAATIIATIFSMGIRCSISPWLDGQRPIGDVGLLTLLPRSIWLFTYCVVVAIRIFDEYVPYREVSVDER